ncbi:hypothetical protein B0H21DRAFT_309947 [Amylocystis lapponica]|nr:hypothetical protein B0H21DRAFT_309947 [Amylocystis lapponica]
MCGSIFCVQVLIYMCWTVLRCRRARRARDTASSACARLGGKQWKTSGANVDDVKLARCQDSVSLQRPSVMVPVLVRLSCTMICI